MKSFAKSLLRLLLTALCLDFWLRVCQREAWLLSRLVEYRDWRLARDRNPQSYRHDLNLSRWPFEPARWAFTARGVFARARMFRGCKVADLCCGDGSTSYLFFSDLAGSIDAIDLDGGAIARGRSRYGGRGIRFHQLDLVRDPLPDSGYDFLVWNAGISYFAEAEIRLVLDKALKASKASVELLGVTPLVTSHFVDHKKEFANAGELEGFLRTRFQVVELQELEEGTVRNLYFRASKPVSV